VRFGELIVALQSIAEFQACFLKLFVFQEGLATSDVLGLGFLRGGARAQKEGGGNYGKQR